MIHLSRWKVILLVASVVFGLLFAYPNMLTQAQRDALPDWMPKKTLALGLDLRGGSYLLLEVDVDAMREKRITNLAEDARTTLANVGITPNNIAREGNGVIIELADPAQQAPALEAMRQLLPRGGQAADRTVAADGAQRIRYDFTEQALRSLGSTAVDQSIGVVRRRIDPNGNREISITRQGADRIVVAAPGQSDPAELERLIGQTALLTFQMVDEDNDINAAIAGSIPPGSELLTDDLGTPYLIKKRVLLSGENLLRADVTTDQNGQTAIGFRFDGEGTRRFADATRTNVNKRFAIILDGKVISAPVIRVPILNGSGVIEGNYSIQEAAEQVRLLNGGALPAPLNVEERRTVGAELGQDAIDKGKLSTMIGAVIIIIFMILAYGFLFGGISVVGLVLNGLLIVACMSLSGAALTLPGIAGLILTFAVAVDANVLIYERMRDEARSGRSVVASMDAGFSKAMTTIIDANLTTLVAAAIMFAFGAGPVRGFAWTLSIGVFTSVLSAVLVSQVLLAYWLKVAKPKRLPIADDPVPAKGASNTVTE